MNMPQFNAEASLGPSMRVYRGKTGHGGSSSPQVSPSQIAQFRFDIFPVMTCCGYVPSRGRFFCTSRQTHPLENCRCERDFFGYPVILCSEPVNALAFR
ncbi:hypothetical protein SAMN06298226_1985 [Nitrosovibrio sp. Nv4]|nr:hypothetical protein SAMN06298226_1985 [Nitrosovibrio sp. Nv4]